MEEIERIHLFDADIDPRGHKLEDVVAELTTGLLVQWSILIDDTVDGRPVIRFTGPRNQLEELRNRYRGVPGAFTPSSANPDAIDPEMQRTLAGM